MRTSSVSILCLRCCVVQKKLMTEEISTPTQWTGILGRGCFCFSLRNKTTRRWSILMRIATASTSSVCFFLAQLLSVMVCVLAMVTFARRTSLSKNRFCLRMHVADVSRRGLEYSWSAFNSFTRKPFIYFSCYIIATSVSSNDMRFPRSWRWAKLGRSELHTQAECYACQLRFRRRCSSVLYFVHRTLAKVPVLTYVSAA